MDKIQVPEFIKQEMPKIYGSSVLDSIPENDSDNAFNDIIDDDKVESDREDLKSSDTGKVSATVTTDALNGIKSSTVNDNEDEMETIEAILNEQDIRGRTITNSGKAMIKDLLKSDPTEDELKSLSNSFNEWVKNNYSKNNIENDLNSIDIENILGNRITEKLKAITIMDPDSYESVLRRFAFQLYNTYQKVVQYNDDMRQLSKLAKKVNEYSNNSLTDINSDSDFDKNMDTINSMSNDISAFLDKMSKLDDRNRRLKQSYSLDDYDIRTVQEVKDCLEKAISFEKVYDKIDCTKPKLIKEFKSEKSVNKSIENWISDIRNDSNTLFTFPVNDYLSIEESRIQLTNYIETSIYGDIIVRNNITVPDDTEDISKFLVTSGVISEDDIKTAKIKARVLLYVLSRTFKHKKLNSVNERRILSYTLEMLSKLGIESYRTKIMDLTNYAYSKIYE